jgi:urate oxidase
MPLLRQTHGKGRVRIMRVHRGDPMEVRELSMQVLLDGDFDACFTDADNRNVISTDTVKNVVNIVARDNLQAGPEAFARAVAARFLDRYEQVFQVNITSLETRWNRMVIDGAPHPHSFTLDGNGRGLVTLAASRATETLRSGVDGFTFLKCTASGWVNYLKDPYTTLKETDDRIAATSMAASWLWQKDPADFTAANDTILATAMKVFASTYSHSVQDSLYRMGEAVLEAMPEVAEIAMACPNKHYLPINLSAFDMSSDNMIFTPTDEPHGQIECVVGR